LIGEKVGGYRVVAPLGAGWVGTVYRALDLEQGREVALRAMRQDLECAPDAIERFRAEARSLARLRHPAIGAIHDFFWNHGTGFFVMELVCGESFGSLLRGGGLGWERALELLAAPLEGIEQAHRQGILHLDLKPNNLVVTASGRVRVTDFCVARLVRPGCRRAGLAIGSAHHLAPEQVRDQPVDRRADIYALGSVLFEALTGRPPFAGESDEVILRAQVEEPPPSPRAMNSAIPEWLDAAVQRALAKRRDDRFQSARELRYRLMPRSGKPARGRLPRLAWDEIPLPLAPPSAPRPEIAAPPGEIVGLAAAAPASSRTDPSEALVAEDTGVATFEPPTATSLPVASGADDTVPAVPVDHDGPRRSSLLVAGSALLVLGAGALLLHESGGLNHSFSPPPPRSGLGDQDRAPRARESAAATAGVHAMAASAPSGPTAGESAARPEAAAGGSAPGEESAAAVRLSSEGTATEEGPPAAEGVAAPPAGSSAAVSPALTVPAEGGSESPKADARSSTPQRAAPSPPQSAARSRRAAEDPHRTAHHRGRATTHRASPLGVADRRPSTSPGWRAASAATHAPAPLRTASPTPLRRHVVAAANDSRAPAPRAPRPAVARGPMTAGGGDDLRLAADRRPARSEQVRFADTAGSSSAWVAAAPAAAPGSASAEDAGSVGAEWGGRSLAELARLADELRIESVEMQRLYRTFQQAQPTADERALRDRQLLSHELALFTQSVDRFGAPLEESSLRRFLHRLPIGALPGDADQLTLQNLAQDLTARGSRIDHLIAQLEPSRPLRALWLETRANWQRVRSLCREP
jgi:serine/threonine protein kinase